MTYAEQEAIEAVLGFITTMAGVPTQYARADSTLVEDLAIDSLTMIEVAAAVQDALDTEVPGWRLERAKTVDEVVALVRRVVAA